MPNESLQAQMQTAEQASNPAVQADETGTINRDQTLKEEIVRRVLYVEAAQMSVGEQIVGTDTLNSLSVDFTYPGEGDAQYPVARDGETRPWRFGWSDFSMRLKKAQTRYFIDDSAKLEGMGDRQQDVARRRASEALALRKDENILGTVANGAISANETSLNSGEEWNNDSGLDPVERLHQMWTKLVTAAPLTDLNVGNIEVVMPAEIWTEMQKLEMIGNVQQQLQDYTERAYNFNFRPTRLGMDEDHQVDLQDKVIMLIPGSDTAMHGRLSADFARSRGVPLTESWRNQAAGRDIYSISQWYNTGIMSHESAKDGKTPRIAVESNVNVNV